MSEKLAFFTIFLSAWRAALSKKLPWVFGFLLAIAGALENRFTPAIPDTASLSEFLQVLANQITATPLLFFLILIFLFGFEVLGKSNLIVALSFVTGKTDLPNHPSNLSAIGKNFLRTFLLECLALLFLLAALGVVALPSIIASSQNPLAVAALQQLGFFVFIPIAISFFFVKQFATFYLLLSPLRMRGSIEAGCSLFSRFIFPSLFFGIFSFTLTVLFTFLINNVILILIALFEKISLPIGEASLAITVGILFFTWFGIFQQALWLAFFKSIAGSHKTEELAKEKETVFDNQTLPEIPPAQ